VLELLVAVMLRSAGAEVLLKEAKAVAASTVDGELYVYKKRTAVAGLWCSTW
jgi:hypothetical protein